MGKQNLHFSHFYGALASRMFKVLFFFFFKGNKCPGPRGRLDSKLQEEELWTRIGAMERQTKGPNITIDQY